MYIFFTDTDRWIDGLLDPLNGGIRLHLRSFAQGVMCALEDHVDC